jgi:transketolase
VKIIISEENKIENQSMANIYFNTMMDIMKENQNVIDLEADLAACIMDGKYKVIKEKYPDQVINCGIQEANMVGVACGLSNTGYIPYVHSFAPFISRRCNDQIFISGCYSKSNVRLVGSDPGIMAAYNGGTHMPFEDLAVLRAFPELTIIEPTDSVMADQILRKLVSLEGMFYLRMARKTMNKIYMKDSEFQIGKGNIIREGKDVTIIASGIMVAESIRAANMLKDEGIEVRLIDMFTIKPIDEELIIKSAKETGAIVTAENHNIIGGLGSAVSEVVTSFYPVVVEKVGIKDHFGEVGSIEFLKEKYGLTAKEIYNKAKKAYRKKMDMEIKNEKN